MTQFIRPNTVDTSGGWSGSYTAIDESVPSDSDVIQSPSNPSGAATDIGLSDPAAPGSGSHTLRVRASASGGKNLNLSAQVIADGSAKASIPSTGLSSAFTTLSATSAAAISDWNGATAHIAASVSGGGSPTTASVSWVEVELPNPVPPSVAPQNVTATWDDFYERVIVDFDPYTDPTRNGIVIYRDGVEIGRYSSPSGTSVADSFPLPGDHNYQVAFSGPGGDGPLSAAAPVTVPALPPTNFSARPGNVKVDLTWTMRSYATGHNVYRDGVLIATLGAVSSFTDDTVTNGVTYSYEVSTLFGAEESALAGPVTAKPSASVTYTPAVANDDGTAADFAGYYSSFGNLHVGNNLMDGTYRAYARFVGLNVDQGETISSATLRLCVQDTINNGFDIHQAAAFVQFDNPAAPTYSGAVFGLPYDNTTRVDFDILDGTPSGTFIDLDVTAGLQAIVNRPGWVSGNAAIIVLVDTGTTAGTDASLGSFDVDPATGPQLLVDLTPSGPAPSAGTATGSTSWTGAASGAAPVLPDLSGSASGAFAVAGSAAGVTPALAQKAGAATGGFAVAGSAAGAAPVVPVSTGSATATFDLTGDATGAAPVLPVRAGAAAGSFGLSGTAAGSAPAVPMASGSASGGFALTGAAAGELTPSGASSGGFAASGSAAGSVLMGGSASGTTLLAGLAAGVAEHTGSTSGGFGSSGSATGSTATSGATAGAFAYTGSAAGSVLHEGASTGGFAIAGTSTGSAPALDAQTGAAHGAFTLAGSASGATSKRGDGSGALALSGTAAGSAPSRGAGAGSWAAVGNAAGASSREGVAGGGFAFSASAAGTAPLVGTESGAGAGTFRYTGTASGQRHQSGDATGSFELSGAALGDAPAVAGVSGSAAGSLSWSGDATGTTAPLGTASGVVTVAGSASGSAPVIPIPTGSAGGSFELSGESSGTAPNGGAASGSVTWTGVALAGYWGVRSGAATGSWTNYGRAHGRPTYPQVKHTAATINHNLTGANSTPNTTGARVATNGASARVRAVY